MEEAHLPRHEAHAEVELGSEIVVEVEQVAVRGRRQRVEAGELAQCRPLLLGYLL